MYSNANRPFPDLPAMALGFYHEDRNGLNIVGHGGDTVFFHSDLHLFLDKNVGLYMSMNSIGKNGAAHALREELLQQFADRYFPAPAQSLPTVDTAKAHGAGDVGPLCQQPRGRVQLPPPRSAARRNFGRRRQGREADRFIDHRPVRLAAQVARGEAVAVAGSERSRLPAGDSRRQRRDQDVLDHALCADHRVPAGAGIAQRRLDLPGGRPRLAHHR